MRLPERENLERFVCGVSRSRTFLSILSFHPLLKHTSTNTPPTFYKLRHQWLAPRSVSSISSYYLPYLAHIPYRSCRPSLPSKPHANRLEVTFFQCHFHIYVSTYHFCLLPSIYSGKAPRKQLATKAARKTAQVCRRRRRHRCRCQQHIA